ncbi:Glutamine--fructose-6-phosphate aminotransferase [isomerizing] [Symbiodinium microadriaticum]|uniref:glutamine--fructose-6-phosphate transaminase (isomerizing) n=1 Tax=Symbiodinium microadriaticum TaxID=2951 RepID=A0A1Q9CUF9_SYMMI|nr:Glutamine--fructose-6-phosphate aminotransferase [isomerizing] [Symbiodinium microadriaticum]
MQLDLLLGDAHSGGSGPLPHAAPPAAPLMVVSVNVTQLTAARLFEVLKFAGARGAGVVCLQETRHIDNASWARRAASNAGWHSTFSAPPPAFRPGGFARSNGGTAVLWRPVFGRACPVFIPSHLAHTPMHRAVAFSTAAFTVVSVYGHAQKPDLPWMHHVLSQVDSSSKAVFVIGDWNWLDLPLAMSLLNGPKAFLSAVDASSGSAGLDGWQSSELRALHKHAPFLLEELYQLWLDTSRAENIPDFNLWDWKTVGIPKRTSLDSRPISVASVFVRAWHKALLSRSPRMSNVLPSSTIVPLSLRATVLSSTCIQRTAGADEAIGISENRAKWWAQRIHIHRMLGTAVFGLLRVSRFIQHTSPFLLSAAATYAEELRMRVVSLPLPAWSLNSFLRVMVAFLRSRGELQTPLAPALVFSALTLPQAATCCAMPHVFKCFLPSLPPPWTGSVSSTSILRYAGQPGTCSLSVRVLRTALLIYLIEALSGSVSVSQKDPHENALAELILVICLYVVVKFRLPRVILVVEETRDGDSSHQLVRIARTADKSLPPKFLLPPGATDSGFRSEGCAARWSSMLLGLVRMTNTSKVFRGRVKLAVRKHPDVSKLCFRRLGRLRQADAPVHNGLCFAVRDDICAHALQTHTSSDGEFITSDLEILHISLVWQRPSEVGTGLAEALSEQAEGAFSLGRPWLGIGDFNQTPTQVCPDAGFCTVAVTDDSGAFVPSRWEGRRCIDFGVCYGGSDLPSIRYGTAKISDHKIVHLELPVALTLRQGKVIKATPRYHRPEKVEGTEWAASLQRAWEQAPEIPEGTLKLSGSSLVTVRKKLSRGPPFTAPRSFGVFVLTVATAWVQFSSLLARWQQRNRYPEVWTHYRSSFIPKRDPEEHVLPVDALRPLIVQRDPCAAAAFTILLQQGADELQVFASWAGWLVCWGVWFDSYPQDRAVVGASSVELFAFQRGQVATSINMCENQKFPPAEYPLRPAYLKYKSLKTGLEYCQCGKVKDIGPWKFHDAGGTGDCGYRAVVIALKHAQKKPTRGINEIVTEASKLRLLSVGHMIKHKAEYADKWAFDQEESFEGWGADAATVNFEQYPKLIAKCEVWIDQYQMCALAERIGVPIVVWHFCPKKLTWLRAASAPWWKQETAQTTRKQKRLVLALREKHYRAVLPDDDKDEVEVPKGWLRFKKTKSNRTHLLQAWNLTVEEVDVRRAISCLDRKARDHGFAAYTQAGNVGRGRWSEERQWADAALLVSTRVKSRAHAYISHAGGQAVLVWAAGLLLCSCYVAQNEHADEFLAELTAHIGAAGPATRWAVMGDFNLEPHENPLVAALQRCHGGVLQVCSPDGVALPTRWRGTRSIDYLVGHCACTVSRLQFGMSKYNDHKLLVGSLSASAGAEVVNWMLVLLLVLTPSRLGGPKKLGHRPLVMSGTNVTPWLNQVLPPRCLGRRARLLFGVPCKAVSCRKLPIVRLMETDEELARAMVQLFLFMSTIADGLPVSFGVKTLIAGMSAMSIVTFLPLRPTVLKIAGVRGVVPRGILAARLGWGDANALNHLCATRLKLLGPGCAAFLPVLLICFGIWVGHGIVYIIIIIIAAVASTIFVRIALGTLLLTRCGLRAVRIGEASLPGPLPLRVWSHNVSSWHRHGLDLLEQASDANVQALILQECNITAASLPSVSHTVQRQGWQMACVPKPGSRKGGVAVLVQRPLAVQVLQQSSSNQGQLLVTQLHGLQRSLRVLAAYRPPDADLSLLYQNPCRAMGLCFKLLPVTMLAAAKKLGSRGAPFFLGPGSDGSAAAKKLGYDWGPFIWWAAAKKLGLPLGSLHVSFFLGFWVGWVGRDQEAGLALGSLHIAVLGSWVGWVGHSHVEFHSCFLLSGSWLGWVGHKDIICCESIGSGRAYTPTPAEAAVCGAYPSGPFPDLSARTSTFYTPEPSARSSDFASFYDASSSVGSARIAELGSLYEHGLTHSQPLQRREADRRKQKAVMAAAFDAFAPSAEPGRSPPPPPGAVREQVEEEVSLDPRQVYSAARHGRHKEVEAALLAGFNPDYADSFGNRLFHVACQNGNKRICKLAIKYGGDMDAQNAKGNTGLHFLFAYGYADIAEYFIEKGADDTVANGARAMATQHALLIDWCTRTFVARANSSLGLLQARRGVSMCGIFAYIGNREAASLLITALKRLEYRGYDSAGIGIHGVPLKVRKKAGKVSNLEEDVAHAGTQVSGTLGIAHTRWATHGKPTDCNAHPQTTAESSIAVVHNGVIENYAALKEQLSSKGYKFVSQTDTELLAHLVQDLKKQMEGATYTEGRQAHHTYLTQRSYGMMGEARVGPRSDVDGEKHLPPTPPTERKIFYPPQMRRPTSAAMQVEVELEQRCERSLFLYSSDLSANTKDEQYRQGPTTDEVIRLEQGMQASPRTRSASTSSSSSPLLRPAATGAERYKTPAMPSSFKFSWKYDIDWSAIEVERYPIHDQMKLFIQALASSAKFKIHGGALLEHNPAWDRGTDATEESMRRYYYLVSSDLALKEPPLPTKAERILFWSHATDVGSLWSMLRNRDMLPMSAHGVASFGCNIFYALGHEVCGGEEDEYNIARVLYNTTKSAKNLASVVVGGKAWGSLRKVYGGSVETARVATEEDEVLKDSNAKAYCVSRNRYSFNYIAFEQLAQPPSTTRGLINQYIRAANLKPPGRQALL